MRPNPAVRTIATTTAVALAWIALLLMTLGGTAGAVVGDGILGSTTTTTLLHDPVLVLGDLVDGATTTSTTTTTVQETTTTTTPPVDHSTGEADDTTTPAARFHATTAQDGGRVPVVGGPLDPSANQVTQHLPPVASAVGQPVVVRPATVAAAVPNAGTVRGPAPTSDGVSLYAGRSTLAIFGKLGGLELAPNVIARLLAPFPVAGRATYSDDFGAPRHDPDHAHEGTDIFAATGTPVIASADGVVGRMDKDAPLAGTSLRLTASGGTYFFYAHLDRFAPGLQDGDEVSKGEVLGFVGTTGNAARTDPHLHFEIHPRGAAAVNPVPYLDQWLADAMISAESVQGGQLLSLMPGARNVTTKSRSGGAKAVGHAAASRVADLGEVQTVSSSAIAPAGVILLGVGAVLVAKRVRRRPVRSMR